MKLKRGSRTGALHAIVQVARDSKWWIEHQVELRLWDGSVPAPAAIKQQVVKGYARSHGLRTLVETGTYRGDMTAATRWQFEQIHTIELDPLLATQARKRFWAWRRVHVYQGNSAEVLPRVLETLSAPALLWLDAHYCEGVSARGETTTPIVSELDLALTHPFAQVILIDDARHFGQGDYPTVEHIEEMVHRAGRLMEVDLDIIRIV